MWVSLWSGVSLPQVELGSIWILALVSYLSVDSAFFVWMVMQMGSSTLPSLTSALDQIELLLKMTEFLK